MDTETYRPQEEILKSADTSVQTFAKDPNGTWSDAYYNRFCAIETNYKEGNYNNTRALQDTNYFQFTKYLIEHELQNIENSSNLYQIKPKKDRNFLRHYILLRPFI